MTAGGQRAVSTRFRPGERRRRRTEDAEHLQDLIARADLLRGKAHDPKLRQLIETLKGLLAEGFRPVRYVRHPRQS